MKIILKRLNIYYIYLAIYNNFFYKKKIYSFKLVDGFLLKIYQNIYKFN